MSTHAESEDDIIIMVARGYMRVCVDGETETDFLSSARTRQDPVERSLCRHSYSVMHRIKHWKWRVRSLKGFPEFQCTAQVDVDTPEVGGYFHIDMYGLPSNSA